MKLKHKSELVESSSWAEVLMEPLLTSDSLPPSLSRLQMDSEAADVLNELQVKLSTVLDNFSTVFARR